MLSRNTNINAPPITSCSGHRFDMNKPTDVYRLDDARDCNNNVTPRWSRLLAKACIGVLCYILLWLTYMCSCFFFARWVIARERDLRVVGRSWRTRLTIVQTTPTFCNCCVYLYGYCPMYMRDHTVCVIVVWSSDYAPILREHVVDVGDLPRRMI